MQPLRFSELKTFIECPQKWHQVWDPSGPKNVIESSKAQNRGTSIHEEIQKDLSNSVVAPYIQNLKTAQQEYKIEIETSESSIFRGLKVKGTIDCLSIDNGKVWIYEFKTTARPSFCEKYQYPVDLWQSVWYCNLYEEMHGCKGACVPIVLELGPKDLVASFSPNRQLVEKDLVQWIEVFKKKTILKNPRACNSFGKMCPFFSSCFYGDYGDV
jgi:hypothetical protein